MLRWRDEIYDCHFNHFVVQYQLMYSINNNRVGIIDKNILDMVFITFIYRWIETAALFS